MIDNPAKLPEIDVVEVVNLCRVDVYDVSNYMQNVGNSEFIRLSGNSAQKIAELWRKLPEGMSARCHFPPYGFRFYKDEKLILQGSVCWQCNNIYGDVNGDEFAYRFNGEDQISQELLSICKSLCFINR